MFFFFKQKTAYEMRISDWSSDVCSSDLVLSGVTQDMLIAREETFGPVAGVIRFETEADAIALANDSEFGLAAYFYARDLGRVRCVEEALETGIVGKNGRAHG